MKESNEMQNPEISASRCNTGTNPSPFNSKDAMVTMCATFFSHDCVS